MTTYFMETPILRDGKKVTVEFSASEGEGPSLDHPGDGAEFEIVCAFVDDVKNVLSDNITLTDDENETAHEYLAEKYIYEPEQDENY